MPRLRERNTGSVVNVPEEKVQQVLALGYYERVSDSKSTAKKASSSKTKK